MNALEIRNLCKTYSGKKGLPVHALTNVDLIIKRGEVFGFLGPNGAGKSTTIKILTGLISASAGSASIFGIPVTENKSKKRVGFLPENPSFYDFLTAREYLSFVGKAFGLDEQTIRSKSESVLKLMGIYDASERPIGGYSKGMVQRLGFAQALLHDPDLYILDEPMSGLDPLGRALVKDIIKDLKEKNKTVFFSTHITSDVEIVCDRVGILVAGKLQVVDQVEHILQSGIEGYYVQVSNYIASNDVFAGISFVEKTPGIKEAYVPQVNFNKFVAKIIENGGELDLIEPKRKDLESFLLEVVSRNLK